MQIDLAFQSLSFAGHESFPPRSLWPKKAYDAVRRNPEVFGEEDTIVELGVGRNMVRSIRHWGLAFGVLAEEPESRGRRVAATAFGEAFFGDEGWDPFLEDPGTLWWLHWRLARSPERSTAATWLFARPRGGRFTRDELVAELEGLIRDSRARKVPRVSLKRDVDVLMRIYLKPTNTRAGKERTVDEDALDSPLCSLGLVRQTSEKGAFELVVGPQPTLPDAVVEAAVLDFAATTRAGARTVPLHTLLYAPLSPGRVFRFTEDALASRLSRLEGSGGIRFDETAGLRQVLLPEAPPDPMDVLQRYYRAWGAAS